MTSEMLHILAVHPSPDLYGSDLMMVRTAALLRNAGDRVEVLVPEHGPLLDRLAANEVDHRVVPFPVLRKALFTPANLFTTLTRILPDTRRLVRLLRETRPDVLYVNTITLPWWLAAAKLARVPVVCHVRELEATAPRIVSRLLTAPLLLADHLISNSQATSTYIATQWSRLRRRTTLVYNGLEFPVADGSDAMARRNRTVRRITVVGRLSPRKGQDVALDAVVALLGDGYDIELELVGDAYTGYEWYEEELRSTARRHGVTERLLLTGFRSPVWRCYTEADVVLVPSRLEPFGSVAAEALAMARPVVVSDVGGLPEIVDHNESGWVVPPGDAPALAAAIRSALDDPTRAAAIAACGYDRVRDRFSVHRYGAQVRGAIRRGAAGR